MRVKQQTGGSKTGLSPGRPGQLSCGRLTRGSSTNHSARRTLSDSPIAHEYQSYRHDTLLTLLMNILLLQTCHTGLTCLSAVDRKLALDYISYMMTSFADTTSIVGVPCYLCILTASVMGKTYPFILSLRVCTCAQLAQRLTSRCLAGRLNKQVYMDPLLLGRSYRSTYSLFMPAKLA